MGKCPKGDNVASEGRVPALVSGCDDCPWGLSRLRRQEILVAKLGLIACKGWVMVGRKDLFAKEAPRHASNYLLNINMRAGPQIY